MDLMRVIFEAREQVRESVESIADALNRIFEQIEESGVFDIESRHRRRKRKRDRARLIEQQYAAEIRRCELERPFRRVYKPP